MRFSDPTRVTGGAVWVSGGWGTVGPGSRVVGTMGGVVNRKVWYGTRGSPRPPPSPVPHRPPSRPPFDPNTQGPTHDPLIEASEQDRSLGTPLFSLRPHSSTVPSFHPS